VTAEGEGGRLRPGDVLAAAAAVVLLGVTFLDWYAPAARGEGLDAWHAFAVVDLVIGLAATLALALTALNVGGRGPAVPVGVGVVTSTISLVALILVAYRILNQPGPNDVIEVEIGAWLGLAATAALFAGAWWSMADDRPRPADPPAPEPELRAAPSRS
jgi:hypothetical protein